MVKVTGRRQLANNFQRLRRIEGKDFDPAMRFALEPLRGQAETNARLLRQPGSPKGGHLDEGIVTRRIAGTGRFERIFWVTLTGRARSIGHLVEYGTRPHDQPIRMIFHPGATPKPFFRSADAVQRPTVQRTFANLTWQVVRATIIPVR